MRTLKVPAEGNGTLEYVAVTTSSRASNAPVYYEAGDARAREIRAGRKPPAMPPTPAQLDNALDQFAFAERKRFRKLAKWSYDYVENPQRLKKKAKKGAQKM